MSAVNLLRLLTLAALWGASFLFLRIGVPALGAVWTILARVGLAALFLALVAVLLRRAGPTLRHWRPFLVLGLLNGALPFLLYAHAATQLPASLLAVINATSPIWAALIATALTRVLPTAASLLGLALGVAGVAVLVGADMHAAAGGALLAALAAPACYGLATHYARSAPTPDPFATAQGSMTAATLLLLPLLPFAPLPSWPSPEVAAAVLALGVLCSGVAFLLYFRLVAEIGPTQALTVTYLIPAFGILWGVLFLDEVVGWHTLAGGLAVLAGTALVNGLRLPGLATRTRHA